MDLGSRLTVLVFWVPVRCWPSSGGGRVDANVFQFSLWGLGCRVCGVGCGVEGVGCKVQRSETRVSDETLASSLFGFCHDGRW